MAPHIARMAGMRGQVRTLLTASAIGAALMMAADWLGRSADFPYEIPAGVVAAFIGGPYFLWVIRAQGRSCIAFVRTTGAACDCTDPTRYLWKAIG